MLADGNGSWLKDIEESHWTINSPSVSGEDL